MKIKLWLSAILKRRFRFQFGLLAFLLLVTAIAVVMGVWMAWVQPVRDQWLAVEPLLERGARVETSPSELPDWMKSVLPTGQTENIEALFFKNTSKLKSDDLKCLARLPHLKRLYLEQSGLDDAGVAWIADCPTIERLAIWRNLKITNKSVETLVSLPNLKVVDVHETRMDWRSMIEFQKKPQVKVIQYFQYTSADSSELETMAEFNNETWLLSISGTNATSIPKAMRLFPNLRMLNLDNFESLNRSNIKLLKASELTSVFLDSCEADPEGDCWRALLGEFDVHGLSCRGSQLSIHLRCKDGRDLLLNITGVSLQDLALLNEFGGLAAIRYCTLRGLAGDEFESLGFLSWLTDLETLELNNCNVEIVSLVDLPELKKVTIHQCSVGTNRNIDLPAATQLVISSLKQQPGASLDFLKDVRSVGKS